jgi:streptomycin 6-kinase
VEELLPDREPLIAAAEAVAAEWGVSLGPPFSFSRYSYVAPAGDAAVVKATPADDDEADHEADALARWDGDGAVRVLRNDPSRRALLLERASPGDDLSTVSDDEATAIAIDLGRRLWQPAGSPFRPVVPHVRRWLDAAERRGCDPGPIATARRLLEELEPRQDTLVHGDFHHHNLLRHGDRWVAIDPKAYLAEPEFDVPSFLWNPFPGPGQPRMRLDRTLRRLAAFEAAGLDPARMRAWTAIRGAYLDVDASATIRALL